MPTFGEVSLSMDFGLRRAFCWIFTQWPEAILIPDIDLTFTSDSDVCSLMSTVDPCTERVKHVGIQMQQKELTTTCMKIMNVTNPLVSWLMQNLFSTLIVRP